MNFSFGSDPELMLMKDGNYKSAIGIIQGSNQNRIKIRGHEFYYDNVLAECAIKPSCSKEEVVKNFNECLQLYAEMVHPFKLVLQAAHNYDKSELKSPDAVRVGCDPEYCPYEMKIASSPTEEILHGTLRTCGGHIHLGHEVLTEGNNGILAMYMMDLFLGVPSLWLDKDPTSGIRREMYGAAGRYRVKSYGMEYRSLSNFWLQSPRFVEFIYDMSEFVTNFVVSGKCDEHWLFDWDMFYNTSNLADAWKCLTYDPNVLRDAIRTGDKSKAQSCFDLAQSLMPQNLKEEMLCLCDINLKPFYSEWNIKI
jgi:hypothetical protein